jgi:hypothetical protein
MVPGASIDADDAATGAVGDGPAAMAPELAIASEADTVGDAGGDPAQAEMANASAAGTAIARILACMQPPWHTHAAVKLRTLR